LAREAEYHKLLDASQAVIAELGALGAPGPQLEVVYFSYADAKDDQARPLADTYLGVLADQIETVRTVQGGEAAERLPLMIKPTSAARRQTAAAYEDWTALLETPRGRLAVLFGMVSAPSAGMGVYERTHPRQK
jgi:hypothetical protein